jgi:hypothetical protein
VWKKQSTRAKSYIKQEFKGIILKCYYRKLSASFGRWKLGRDYYILVNQEEKIEVLRKEIYSNETTIAIARLDINK